jgi:hypothetical protein
MTGYGREMCKVVLGLLLAVWASACSPTPEEGELLSEEAAGTLDGGHDDGGPGYDAGYDAGLPQCTTDSDCSDPDAVCQADGTCGWAFCQAVEVDAGTQAYAWEDPTANVDGEKCATAIAWMGLNGLGIVASVLGIVAGCAPTAGLGCAAGIIGLVATMGGFMINADQAFEHCPRCVACGVARVSQKVHDALVAVVAAGEVVYGNICGNPPPNQDCADFRKALDDLTAKKNRLAAKLATCPWWTKWP